MYADQRMRVQKPLGRGFGGASRTVGPRRWRSQSTPVRRDTAGNTTARPLSVVLGRRVHNVRVRAARVDGTSNARPSRSRFSLEADLNHEIGPPALNDLDGEEVADAKLSRERHLV